GCRLPERKPGFPLAPTRARDRGGGRSIRGRYRGSVRSLQCDRERLQAAIVVLLSALTAAPAIFRPDHAPDRTTGLRRSHHRIPTCTASREAQAGEQPFVLRDETDLCNRRRIR